MGDKKIPTNLRNSQLKEGKNKNSAQKWKQAAVLKDLQLVLHEYCQVIQATGGKKEKSKERVSLCLSFLPLQMMGFPSVADPIDLTQNPPPSNLLIPQLANGACSFEFQELDTN
jgi:hypothetical protein